MIAANLLTPRPTKKSTSSNDKSVQSNSESDSESSHLSQSSDDESQSQTKRTILSAHINDSDSISLGTRTFSSDDPTYKDAARAKLQSLNSKAQNEAIKNVPMKTLSSCGYTILPKTNPSTDNNVRLQSIMENNYQSENIAHERLSRKRRSSSYKK